MTCAIYRLLNTVNGKSYIGVSNNPQRRFREHCSSYDLIGRAIKKYGRDKFSLNVLVISDRHYCYLIEPHCITSYKTKAPDGYNISPGGDRGPDLTGRKHNPETIKKIAIAHKGKKREPFSEEWKKNLGLARKGKKRPPEIIAKWMETKRKNPKPLPPISEETREKKRRAMRGKVPWNKGKKGCFSEATIQRLRDSSSKQRKPHSEETKRRIGAKSRGRFFSVETRKQMSKSRKLYLSKKRTEK